MSAIAISAPESGRTALHQVASSAIGAAGAESVAESRRLGRYLPALDQTRRQQQAHLIMFKRSATGSDNASADMTTKAGRPGYLRRGVEQHVIYFRPTSYGTAVIRVLHQRMDAARHL